VIGIDFKNLMIDKKNLKITQANSKRATWILIGKQGLFPILYLSNFYKK